ncbi:MAG: PEP-CTERM sorting domain-containing protein [Phycisphaerae bacterium]|nr:PEP-CTERM sorting domain-containing protein [Phycisphaerae bacterium]
MADRRARGVVGTLRAAVVVVFAFACCLPAGAATRTDDFADGVIDASLWVTPPDIRDDCDLTEINGRLEFTGSLVPFSEPRAQMDSQAVGHQDLDWTTMVDMFIDGDNSQYPGIAVTDGIVSTVVVRPSGAASQANGEDRVEMNFAFLDVGNFGGSGWDHGLRFNGRTNDSDDQEIVLTGHPSALQVTMKLDYSAASRTISGSYDSGSGFVSLGTPVDTSAWGMAPEEVFGISVEASAGGMSGEETSGTFQIDSGQLYFDNFSMTDGGGISPGIVVLDDHFDGDSGGTPAGWSLLMGVEGPTGVVESGSNVVINGTQDNPTVIASDTTFDPQDVETTIRVAIDEVTPDGRAWTALFSSDISTFFAVQLRSSDGRLEVTGGPTSQSDSHELVQLSSYDGGEAILTITLDADSFRIRCDVEDYDSGNLLFADYFPTTNFTLADLGESVMSGLFAAGQPAGGASFDWITVTRTPEPATMGLLAFGATLTLVRRRRK